VYKTGNLVFKPDGTTLYSPVGNRVTAFELKAHTSSTLDFEARSDVDRDLVEFCELSLTLGFPFAAPPGVPQDRVDILRKAFESTFKDVEYLSAAERAGLETTPRSGEALAAAVRRAARTPPALIERYKQIAAEGRAN
jgi:hypothetical protein